MQRWGWDELCDGAARDVVIHPARLRQGRPAKTVISTSPKPYSPCVQIICGTANVHEVLYRRAVIVCGVTDERVKRVAQASLTHELERGAAHPAHRVYLGRAGIVHA